MGCFVSSVFNSPLKTFILPVSLCFSLLLGVSQVSLPVLAAPDAMTPASTESGVTPAETTAPASDSSTSSTPSIPSTPSTTTETPAAIPGAVPASTSTPNPAEAAQPSATTPTNAAATPAAEAAAKPGAELSAEIVKLDGLRIKAQCANAQIEQRLMPIADMQKQIVTLEGLLGRSNPNVVMLYHLLARRYQQQAYVTGKFADSEKLYRWLTDTATAQQKGFDELMFGSAYLGMADGYRMTKRYDVALTTYQRALPVFLRGKKAAKALIVDYDTFGESAYEKQAKSSSDAKVKSLIVANKAFIEAIDKAQGNERYIASPVPDAYFGMAFCYLKKDDLAKAKEYLAKAKANGLTVIDIAKLKAAAKKPGAKAPAKPVSKAAVKKAK